MVNLLEQVEASVFDGEDEEEQLFIPESERQIAWEPQAPSAYDLHRRRGRGRLELQPSFQRRGVWDEKKQSRFIESILLDVPLPYFYLAEDNHGKQVVVDGQQRLTAVFSYLDSNYVLQGLRVMEELNGKLFRDLPDRFQTAIETRALNLILIKPSSNPNMRYDVFERLNTGAVQLNPQELRNCVNRGQFNDLIIELSGNSVFQQICGFSGPHPRMKDIETVLRFFAFFRSYPGYKKPLKSFLDSEMEFHAGMGNNQLQPLRTVFTNTVNLTRQVLGSNPFRIYEASEAGGKWGSRVNINLYDAVMYGFAKRLHQRVQIVQKGDSIREALINILVSDERFIDALSVHTSDDIRVRYRIEAWSKELDEILADADAQGPRLFSYELKQELYKANPTCGICGQRIHGIDDAAVDHVEPYWKGGRTIPENARLTHRYCNLSRGRG